MPVTNLTAASESQSEYKVASTIAQETPVVAKTRKHRFPTKQKQILPSSDAMYSQGEKGGVREEPLAVPEPQRILENNNDTDHLNESLDKEDNLFIENLFTIQPQVLETLPLKLSEQYITQERRDEKPDGNINNTQKNDLSVISLVSINSDENEFMNKPVVKSDIIVGTSSTGGTMIFMNGYSYLHMGISKETIGWRCAKRSEDCKAVIHTFFIVMI